MVANGGRCLLGISTCRTFKNNEIVFKVCQRALVIGIGLFCQWRLNWVFGYVFNEHLHHCFFFFAKISFSIRLGHNEIHSRTVIARPIYAFIGMVHNRQVWSWTCWSLDITCAVNFEIINESKWKRKKD